MIHWIHWSRDFIANSKVQVVRRYALPNGLAVVGVAPVEGASGMKIDLLTGGKSMLNFENLL